jgi:hypothetical protein
MKKSVLTMFLLLSAAWMLKAQTYSGGSGSTGDPYQIANKTDLKYLSEHSGEWSKHFKQTANITFTDADFQSGGAFNNSGAGFIPIGTYSTRFTGSYDGDGYTIDNLYINRSSTDYIGMFGCTDGATINNLGVTNVDITGYESVGGLVGFTYNTYIANTSAVSNSYSTGSVSGHTYVGGLVGHNISTTVSNSYNTGSVTGISYVGGLVGRNNYATVSKSYSTGSVTGKYYVGGLVGAIWGENSVVSNSYSTGDVTRSEGTDTWNGGFCGWNESGLSQSGTIENCYSIGSVYYTGASDPTNKGFVGYNVGGIYTNNFWDSEASNQSTATGATGKTTTQMKIQSTFTGWNFSTIWEIIGGNGANYPTLRNNPEAPTTQASNISFSSVQTTQMTVGWTNGNGTKRVVFAKQASTGTTSPVDNTTYSANTSFGSGTEIATGWYCVYNGYGTSVTITNLSHSTTYIFQVFEYNGGAGEEKYLTSTAIYNPQARTTAAPLSAPTTQATNIVFSSIQSNQITVGWTNGNGTKRVVFAKQANTGTTSPVDNTTYTANTSFGSGTEITTGWYCVYNGYGTSVTVTNLSNSTDYIFQVFEYNEDAGGKMYLTSTASNNPKSQTTAAPPNEPTTQATEVVFSGVQTTQMTVGWTNGNGSSRVVFAKEANSGTTSPVDNTTYTANTSFGGGTEIATGLYCVYNGTGSSVTVTGLTGGSAYIFQVFEYNGGSGEENYLTTTATNNPKSQATISAYSGGDGTSGNPFLIATAADLIELSNTSADWVLGTYFSQTADISFDADETQVDWDGDGSPDGSGTSGFSPIGNSSTNFKGNYNGNRHIIDNLYISRPSTYYIGLFGYAYGATISNLGVTNVDISGDRYAGGLVGYNKNYSTVSNSYSTGSVEGGLYYVGGLVGSNETYSTVSNSYSTCDVTCSSAHAGIILGGFCGYNSSSTIEYCYSIGSVYYPYTSDPTDKGFVGYNSSGTYTNNFWDSEASNQSTATGATAKNTSEMMTQSTYTDWDFTTIWEIVGGDGANYPTFIEDIETPTTQANNILFSDVQTTQMTIGWTNGNGANRVVFAKQANTGTTSPVDNTTYTANTSFGSGTEIATGWYCVYNGNGSSVTITGLANSTDYIFQVFEYNGGSGEELYLTSTAVDNPKSETTAAPPSEPTTQATNIVFSDVQSNQMTVGWTNGNGSNRVVFANEANTGTTTPIDNTTYTANTTFGSGTEIATGWYCVYNGSGSGVTVSGLTVNTTYIFQVFEYNGGSGEENYLTTTATNNPKPRLTLNNGKTSYTYTGAIETWTVPDGVTEVLVKAWGAGGAGGTYGGDGGGSGGYATATLSVTPGQELIIAVGGGGLHGTSNGTGGLGGWPGGGYGTRGDASGGGGGGYSGVFLSSLDQANALIIAGAGGGGTGYQVGGAGGGSTGNRGGTDGGYGGTQSAGGTGSLYGADGSALQGGNGDTRGQIDNLTYDGGGGGGGYYGGEGGYSDAKGGGGGSGFLHPTLASGSLTIGNNGLANAGGTAPNDSDEDYIAGVGNGSNNAADAGNGLIVISYSLPTPPANLTWTGSVDTDWNTAANWDLNAVPVASTDVTISNVDNAPVINSGTGASCYDLTIATGASLTINSGGSLITNGTITNNGTVSMDLAVDDDQWHLISIPTTGITANTFYNDYLQSWDETSPGWSDITDPDEVLGTNTGYALWATGTKSSYTFTGTPLTGEQSATVTLSNNFPDPGEGNDGANLLGNPYPSSIDWSRLDDTWGAVYYWDPSANEGEGDYFEWNDNTGSGSQFIPPLQGFFIVVDESNISKGSGTFSLSNEDRTHSGANGYYKSKIQNGLVIEARSDERTDELFIRFSDNATHGFDLQSDALKFYSGAEGISQIFSFAGDQKLAIDTRPEIETIQLGFKNESAGFYSISAREKDNISEALLEDTKTSTFHNLSKGAYEFTWEVTDDETRFKLHLNAVGIEETPTEESNILIYAANGQIFIKGEEADQVKVCDLMGRVVLQKAISDDGMVSIPVNLQTGVYLVTVQNGKEIKTGKIFIK